MARLDVERKRKTAWPWVAGVITLLLILWGITSLLTDDPDDELEVTVPTVEDTFPPAAIPAPPDLDPEVTGVDAPRDLGDLAPLGEDDVGQVVRVVGEVVATGNRGFWLASPEAVLLVESSRTARKGDTLSIEGTLRAGDPSPVDWLSEVMDRDPRATDWTVVRVVRLVEEDEAGAARPEA